LENNQQSESAPGGIDQFLDSLGDPAGHHDHPDRPRGQWLDAGELWRQDRVRLGGLSPADARHDHATDDDANQSNPWYDPTSNYGASQNSYNTPLVKGAATFDQEYEKYLTEQGFGGNNQKGNFARNLADRAKSGLATAQMSNPNLTARDYLNTTLGSKFLANARAAATPSQRGESPMTANPRARWQSRF
jgi:hypothetical protein